MNHNSSARPGTEPDDSESVSGGGLLDDSPTSDHAKESPASRNPWDDDDQSAAPQPDDPDRLLMMRLLKPSLIALAACTGVIFLSAVASNNAVPSSPLERTSLAIHRLGMLGLLISFFGILVSYRLPAISRLLLSGEPDSNPKSRLANMTSGLSGLFALNVFVGVAMWLAALNWTTMPPALFQLIALISIGVLGNFAILHRGILQAHAIGALLPLAFVMLNSQSTMMMVSMATYGMPSSMNPWSISQPFAVQMTCVLIAGTLSAAIYTLQKRVQHLRERTPRSEIKK
jgi:hypothetical protein